LDPSIALLRGGVTLTASGKSACRLGGDPAMVARMAESGRIHCGSPVGLPAAMLRHIAGPD
jgi:hypothetical protein